MVIFGAEPFFGRLRIGCRLQLCTVQCTVYILLQQQKFVYLRKTFNNEAVSRDLLKFFSWVPYYQAKMVLEIILFSRV